MPSKPAPLFELRSYPRFLTLVLGEGLSMFGDAAFDITLAWIALHATGSAGALMGVMLAQAIPRGLLLLLGGAITDRLDARKVILIAHISRCGAMLVLATLIFTHSMHIWHLYILAALMGSIAAMFTPASESVLPRLLPESAYQRGNAVQGFTEQASFLFGPIIGAGLITIGGAGLAILLNAVTFMIASLTAQSVPRGVPVENLSETSLARDIMAGLTHAWQSHETKLVLFIISVATLSYSGLFTVGLPMLAASWSSSPWALSVLISAWGAGQLIGTAAAAVTGLPHRWGLLIIGMTLVEGIAFTLLGRATSPWIAAAILVPLGIGVAYSSDVALPTFIQTHTPSHLLGRISALLALPRVIFEPISIALLGVALHHSVPWGFTLAAIPVLTLGIYLLSDRKARNLQSRPV